MKVRTWALAAAAFLGLVQSESLEKFRKYYAAGEIKGSILTSPCREYCSLPCFEFFYVSSIDLGRCLALDHSTGAIVAQKNGRFNKSCNDCFSTWDFPDIMKCTCNTNTGLPSNAEFDLREVVTTHCGRLACFDFINELGTPYNGHPDPSICDIRSEDPSGLKKITKPTAAPSSTVTTLTTVTRS